MTLSFYVRDFLLYLEKEKQVSPLTIRNYTHWLGRFEGFYTRLSPPLSEISNFGDKQIKRYERFLNNVVDDEGTPLSRKTKAYHMIALRSFIHYLNDDSVVVFPYKAIPVPIMQHDPAIPLEEKKIQTILARPQLEKPADIRDKAILELLVRCKLKVSELVHLNKVDIDLDKGTLTVRGRKGKRRVEDLPEQVTPWLMRYLSERTDVYQPLFIRYSGKTVDPSNPAESLRLSPRSVQRMVEKYTKTETTNITPQTLRDSL